MDFPWRVKQRQADAHLQRFAEECDAYVEAAHVGFDYDRDPAAGTIRVRLRADGQPPTVLGAIIGDVLHNLRSALDAVAWKVFQDAGADGREEDVYFPVDTNPLKWEKTANKKLPGVDAQGVEVFRQLQPWFRHQETQDFGFDVDVEARAERHPLARLHSLGIIDKHRLPLAVLPRTGDTWLTSPDGILVTPYTRGGRQADLGDEVIEWCVDPPAAVSEVHADGEPLLVLSDDAAQRRQPAVSELRAMQRDVIAATQRVEIDVLGVVTTAQVEELLRLNRAADEAEDARWALMDSAHIIDADYMEKSKHAQIAVEVAKTAALAYTRELFA